MEKVIFVVASLGTQGMQAVSFVQMLCFPFGIAESWVCLEI